MKRLLLIPLLCAALLGAAQSDAALTTGANQIKNETAPGANTATRVGTMFLNLVTSKGNKAEANTWTANQTFTATATRGGVTLGSAASDPSAPVEGELYINTGPDQLKYYNGTDWYYVAGSAGINDARVQFGLSGELTDHADFYYVSGTSSLNVPNIFANLLKSSAGLSLGTLNQATANSGEVSILSGTVAGGSGNSGDVSISTGTSAGGTRGNIELSAPSVLIGLTSPLTTGGPNISALQVAGQDAQLSTILAARFTNDTGGPRYRFVKSRNTSIGSFTIVQSGDVLGQHDWYGDDGIDYGQSAASIAGLVDGTPGSNDMPGRLEFSTTADGAASPTLRYTIKSDNTSFFAAGHQLGIGAAPGFLLDVSLSSAAGATARVINTSTGDAALRVERTGGTTSIWRMSAPSGQTYLSFNNGSTDKFTFTTTGTLTAIQAVVAGGNATTSGYLDLLEDSDNGSNRVRIQAPSSTADQNYVWPTAVPAGNGYALTSTTGGTMSWTTFSTSSSGTWAPSVNSTSGLNSAGPSYNSHYIRVGDEVTIEGRFDVDVSSSTWSLDITLPVASNFTDTYDAVGLVFASGGAVLGKISADYVDDELQVSVFSSALFSGTGGVINFSATYTVK